VLAKEAVDVAVKGLDRVGEVKGLGSGLGGQSELDGDGVADAMGDEEGFVPL
jgi:hypothetical protein